MKNHDFKKLEVWMLSFQVAKEIYVIAENLPSSEKYGLISQIQRAAVSIPANIAEGSKRTTDKDFAQFLNIAHGSAAELETLLLLARDIYAINIDILLEKIVRIENMLFRFGGSLRGR
jgi:four helix bundle protein